MTIARTAGAVLVAACACAAAHGQTLVLDAGPRRVALEFYAPNILRVRVSAAHDLPATASLSVIAAPAATEIRTEERGGVLRVSSARMSVSAVKATGALEFRDAAGRKFLAAAAPDEGSFGPPSDDGWRPCRQAFRISAAEGLYGLGQFEDPVVNYRGRDMLLVQANRTAVNPFLVSSRGYGILWDNASWTRFVDDTAGTSFASAAARTVDYYVVQGPSLDSVVAAYRRLTGEAPMFGRWAYGYWQSKERYKSGAELIDVVREYRRRGIPFDDIVQDWAYWGGNDEFSSMRWDSSAYPAPGAMIDTLHALHAHFMISIWPAFGRSTAIYREMDLLGLLYSEPHWNGGRVYDAYSARARSIYWRYVRTGLYDAGVDAYWMDATEPEFRCTDDRYITALSLMEAGRNALGSFTAYLNPYSLETTRAVYENHRAATDRKRVFILTRSSFSGQQRYAAATWSGDTYATWNTLRVQVAAGINFSMSGIPYWTHDIGGFITDLDFPGGNSDPAYRELYVRWFQFGAFCPIFRAHGTSIPREIWRFGAPGEPAYDALVAADMLRYRLLPYIYATAWRVTHDGYSFIRGLPMDFPTDPGVRSLASQYMFGQSLMVCPVTHPIAHPPLYAGTDITPGHFYDPDGKEHGLDLRVYRGTDFRQLLLARKTDASGIAWTGCLPRSLDTAYSLTMEGTLEPWRTGRYVIHVITDGGVRLRLGGALLVDTPANRERGIFSASLSMNAETRYAFRLDHAQFRTGDALLKINWEEPPEEAASAGRISVYLPRGIRWYDFWTGKKEGGGRTVGADAPIDRIPLYVREGSIVPLGPLLRYAAEPTDEPTELRIYPGRDADFGLYDDSGDSYDYEKGEYAVIPLHWNDRARTLTIGAQTGTYPGAPSRRRFTAVVVRAGHGAGGESTPHPEASVTYTGSALRVKL